ncbi:polysaccharide deacetylase family protein [bacterium]|nr:polysaccharide deacetylase family protein [bacterium]
MSETTATHTDSITIPILYYHLIAAPPAGVKSKSIYMEPERFSRQLSLLKFLGYRDIGFDEFTHYLEASAPPPGRRVMITFDDGHADNCTAAMPVLKEHGFGATIFVTAGYIGKRLNMRIGGEAPIVSADQIRELVRNGIDVQSHGMTHANLADMSLDDARREIVDSKKILEDITGRPVEYFSYPYGVFKPRHIELLKEAGYRAAVSTARGKTHFSAERYCLKRIPVHHERSLFGFVQYLWFKSYDRAQAKLDRQREGKKP